MHAEELKHKPVGPLVGALITLGCLGILVVGNFVVAFLQYAYRIVWPQFVLYGAVILGVLWAIRRFFTEYIYLIERDRITFGRRVGKREKELLFVPLRDVVRIMPCSQERLDKERAEGKKKYRFTFRKDDVSQMIICEKCVIILTCTPEYVECLRDRIHPQAAER